ncbi:hypothetical protein HanRHA438_Chr13g0603371 [Helianthus annuus]|nr:hypothetical protein HanRHA438_Chr13g0603371 [Helianthus annuus]
MSCIIVLGTAFLIPKWATASTNLLWSCGVHTRRGRLSVRAGSSPPPPPNSGESNSPELGWELGVEIVTGASSCWWLSGGGWWVFGVRISNAIARSGVIRVWDNGIRSSGNGSSSSHFENQLDSSSFIFLSEN